jgi:hypothetical protein
LKYKEHGWTICGDLKVISMLLGQQAGYTKYPCFLCEWDSRDKKNLWIKKQWLHRKTLKPGNKNVVKESLVDPGKVLLPPLYIKLDLMKQFVKALFKEGESFKYLDNKFPGKEGVFVGPDIRKLFRYELFESKMLFNEKEA